MSESIDGAPRWMGFYEGVVVDDQDPEKLRRVQVRVDGICSRSAWARPVTFGGGAAQRGGSMVPVPGSTVFVAFLNGDIRRPVYFGGAWGRPDGQSELPADIVAASSSPTEVTSLEFSRGSFSVRLTVDEREGSRSLRATAVLKGDAGEQVLGSIELDVENRVVDIFALGGVRLRSTGFVDIEGLTSRVLRRRVRRSSSPI